MGLVLSEEKEEDSSSYTEEESEQEKDAIRKGIASDTTKEPLEDES